MADIVVLPVIRIERPDEPPPRLHALPAGVTDINVFRYLREQAAIERRASTSLLPDLGPPCDCGGG
jgi:hypothetical protein